MTTDLRDEMTCREIRKTQKVGKSAKRSSSQRRKFDSPVVRRKFVERVRHFGQIGKAQNGFCGVQNLTDARKIWPEFNQEILNAIDEYHLAFAADMVENLKPHTQSIFKHRWKTDEHGATLYDDDGKPISALTPQDIASLMTAVDKLRPKGAAMISVQADTHIHSAPDGCGFDLSKLSVSQLKQINEWLKETEDDPAAVPLAEATPIPEPGE